nr:hypothetical protein [Corynebacterium alimapuense]
MRHSPVKRLSAIAATLVLGAGLVACGSDEDDAATATSTSQETSTTSSTTESTEPTSESTTTSAEEDNLPSDVAEVFEVFGSLAPESLFEQFDSCHPSGIDDAYECSGTEVGQFQFFESMSKALTSTQLLTELRSSQVLEDTGSRVVGWSTLGTMAVITVVDNDEGLVMQQLVSADQVSPEEKIDELRLVQTPLETPTEETSTVASTTSESAS